MCNLAAAGFAISATSAYLGHAQASAMAKAQEQQNRIAARSVANSLREQYGVLQQETHQQRAAVSQDIAENRLEAARARARAEVAAGEGGVDGNSVNALMRDFFSRELGFQETVTANYEDFQQQQHNTARGVYATGMNQVNNLPPVERPSWLATGLKIGAAGVDAAVKMKDK